MSKFLVSLVFAILFVALGGAVWLLLWNYLIAPVTGWSDLAFWQACLVPFLLRILATVVRGRQ